MTTVVDALQDRDGFLWLATEEGLVRFDGVDFQVFDRLSTPGVAWNIIRSLAETPDGTIWAGTNGGGLIRHRAGRFATLTEADGLPGDSVLALDVAHDGTLWMGTDQAVARIVADRIETVAGADDLDGARVRALAADGAGGAWAGAANRLVHVGPDGRVTTGPSSGFPDAPVTSILVSPGGDLWVGTNGGGLVQVVGTEVRRVWTTADGLPDDNVMAVALDSSGALWVGTNGGGVARRWRERWEARSSAQGLCGSLVRSVVEDAGGDIWIAAVDGGVCRLYDQPFRAVTQEDGLGSDVVLGVLETLDGALWFGTAGAGFGRIADDQATMIAPADRIPNGIVMSLAQQPDGTLWAGTAGGGLVRLDPDGSLSVIDSSDGLGSDIVGALTVDHLGRLWVGTTFGGVDVIGQARIDAVDLPQQVSEQRIFNLTQDSRGAIWIGTRGGGVFRLADGELHAFDTDHGFPGTIVLDIVELEPGVMLIGTADAGVVRLRDGAIAACGRREGLWDDVVMRILEDDHGWLWMSSNRGVFRVRRDELMDVLDGHAERVHCQAFGTADGLPSVECNGGFQPAGWRASDGTLWFPTQGGLAAVDPSRVPEQSPPAPVTILNVTNGSNALAPAQKLVLEPGSRSMVIHYSSPTFDHPEKVAFRYRMEGLDSGWVDAGTRRTAFYTNLPPGRLTFHVQARRSSGLAATGTTSMAVVVPGRFYEAGWFPIVAVLVAGAVGFAASRGVVLRLRRRQRELERLIREREEAEAELRASKEQLHQAQKMEAVGRLAGGVAHDFNNFLMTVSATADLAAASLPEGDPLREDMQTILRASEHAAGLTRQLLAFSRQQVIEPRDLDVAREVRSLLPVLKRLLGEDVRPELDVRTDDAWIHADPTQIEQIVLNLASNARDAMPQGGGLEIRVDRLGGPGAEGRVLLEVADTGTGIPADDLDRVFEPFFTTKDAGRGTGLGLATVYATVQALGGTIQVDSEVDIGTRFRLVIPAIDGTAGPTEPGDEGELPPLEATVLLVEDHPGVRAGLAKQLRSVGAQVLEADGTRAAADAMRRADPVPDVVLSDVVMPDGSGRELAAKLQALHPGLPVVLMSGHTDDRLVHHGVADGQIDFLQKPFSLAAAVATLRRVIDRSRASAE